VHFFDSLSIFSQTKINPPYIQMLIPAFPDSESGNI